MRILIADDEARRHELKSHFDSSAVFVSVATGEGIETLIHRLTGMMVDRVARLQGPALHEELRAFVRSMKAAASLQEAA